MSEKQEVAFGYGTCAHCGHSTWPDSDEELDAGMSLYSAYGTRRVSRFDHVLYRSCYHF